MQHIPQPQQVLLQQGGQPLLARGQRVAVQEDAVVVQLRLQLRQPAAGGQQQLGLQGEAGSSDGRGGHQHAASCVAQQAQALPCTPVRQPQQCS